MVNAGLACIPWSRTRQKNAGLDDHKANNPPNLSIPSTIVIFLYEVHWLEGGLQTGVC